MRNQAVGVAAILSSLAVVGLRPDPARACSPPRFEGKTVPPELTVLPTNLPEIWVERSGGNPYTLEGPGGSITLTPAEQAGLYTRYPLPGPLQPDSIYRLVFAQSPRHEVAWTTGPGPDQAAPGVASLTDIIAAVRELRYDSSCIDGTLGNQDAERVVNAFVSDLADSVTGDTITSVQATVTVAGQPVCAIRTRPGPISFHHYTCPSWQQSFAGGSTVCVEVVPYDAAGNAGPPSSACAEARDCRPADDVADGGSLAECETREEAAGCRATSSPAGLAVGFAALLLGAARRRRRVA